MASATQPRLKAVDTRQDVISVCAWCVGLNILHLEERPGDLFVFWRGEDRALYVRRSRETPGGIASTALIVSHGICEPCRHTHFAEIEA